MLDIKVKQNLFLFPTPAGTFYSISNRAEDPARRLIVSLFQQKTSPRIEVDRLSQICGIESKDEVLSLLHRMQEQGWVQGCAKRQNVHTGSLEQILPALLEPLSSEKKVLLADQHGFYISYCGFDATSVERLSALSADLSVLQEKHEDVLKNNLGLNYDAWAIIDAAGNSQVGFWALYIGEQRFVLALSGMPRFNQTALTELIWVLSYRYGKRIKAIE